MLFMSSSVASRIRLLLLLFFLAPAAGLAQWASIGDMPAPRREGNTLTFQNKQGIVAVTVLAPDIVRVRFSPTPRFGRDHSYAIVNRELGDPKATFDVGSQQSVIATPALRVTLRHRPFRVTVADAAGNDLDADDPSQGMSFSGKSVRVAKRLREDEQIYGLGEKNGRLNKRGIHLAGYSYTMWNSDMFGYDPDTDPLYVSVPFYLVLRNGRAHGIFYDNTYRTNIDIGHTSDGLLSWGGGGGAGPK
jgi:alpha-glucosidase